ncbi:MAG: type II toxin-antitoxin system RelE/ParE family toxin [Thermoanaerobaculia bacterium]
MGRYSLSVKASAAREIEAVGQKKDRQRIVARIQSLAEDPRPQGCEKLAGSSDLHRIRVGNYRIVYSIDEKPPVVMIFKIGHRKDVYR